MSYKPSAKHLKGQPVVYMLECRDGSLYTGWTNDFMQRLASHASGKGGKYTRSRLPVQPVYLELAGDRNEALQREAAIKRLSAIKKRELLSSPLNIVDRFDLL
ncbi:MAG: GIY-YIG nuclease family protein [Firmicutes bacterium]|nr:GIY-YIG nuclease family protein [Bacillota bacterium]